MLTDSNLLTSIYEPGRRSACWFSLRVPFCKGGVMRRNNRRRSLAFLVTVASAGPKEDVAAATLKWAQALGEDDPDKVLPFYSDDAVLWGTLSPTVRADRAALRVYFVTAFKVLPRLKVAFADQLIRVYGDTAVNTGYYTFSY